MESKFLISVNYSFIVIKIAAVSSVNIDLCECLSLLDSDCGMCACVCVCVFMCVSYQIRVPAENHIMCQTSVNLMSYFIRHIKLLLVLGSTYVDHDIIIS